MMSTTTIPGLDKHEQTTFSTVFETYLNAESQNLDWTTFAREKRGWDGETPHKDWRASMFKPIKELKPSSWAEYTITNPLLFFKKVCMGPFRGWQKPYEDDEKSLFKATFFDLIENHYDKLREETKRGIQQFFTTKNDQKVLVIHDMFIWGLDLFDEKAKNFQITMMDGHHRIAAIMYAIIHEIPIEWSGTLTIALCLCPIHKYPDLIRAIGAAGYHSSHPDFERIQEEMKNLHIPSFS